jgi:hypothetical protein
MADIFAGCPDLRNRGLFGAGCWRLVGINFAPSLAIDLTTLTPQSQDFSIGMIGLSI